MNDAAAKARAVVREHLGLTHSRFDGLPLTPKEEQLVSAIAAAITEARKDRDMEWWQAVCLVDTVAPTPEAVKTFLLSLTGYEQAEARKDAIEEAARVAHEQTHASSHMNVNWDHGPDGVQIACSVAASIEQAIRRLADVDGT